MKRRVLALAACIVLAASSPPALAGMSKGQTVYVPCSSHIYHGIKTRPFDLTVTLLVRNTDPLRTMKLMAVDYVGSDGRIIKRHLDGVVTVPPLATRQFIVEEKDMSGGAGASFLVRWKGDTAMNEPVAEAVMIGSSNGQGISFNNLGVVVQE